MGSPEPELEAKGMAVGRVEWEEDSLLQVGELAKATGKTVRAIHLYEDLGLLTPVRRSKGRYRLYAPDARLRVSWITKLQSLGLSLPDIQAIMLQRAASESARRAAADLKAVYSEKLAEVRETVRKYRELELELEASLAFLNTCTSACEHEVNDPDCKSCAAHQRGGGKAPELVAGAAVNL